MNATFFKNHGPSVSYSRSFMKNMSFDISVMQNNKKIEFREEAKILQGYHIRFENAFQFNKKKPAQVGLLPLRTLFQIWTSHRM